MASSMSHDVPLLILESRVTTQHRRNHHYIVAATVFGGAILLTWNLSQTSVHYITSDVPQPVHLLGTSLRNNGLAGKELSEHEWRFVHSHLSAGKQTASTLAAAEGDRETEKKEQAKRPLLVTVLRRVSFPFVLLWGMVLVVVGRLLPGQTADNSAAAKPKWSLRQFTEQFMFFNGSNLLKAPWSASTNKKSSDAVVTLLDGTPVSDVKKNVVLVTGATGGTGRRVVSRLLAKGQNVRILVRNLPKAQKVLASDAALAAEKGAALEVIVADITQRQTLLPEMFEGVRKVVSCTAVTIAPKEGDTADRAKYNQGIKFFDPEVVGDTPETVEYNGLSNLLDAVKPRLGTQKGVELFKIEPGTTNLIGKPWGSLDDVVMGGVSESSFSVVEGAGENGEAAGVFSGFVRTENNGGFVSIRTRDYEPPLDLSAYDGLELRLKGDGRRYKFQVRTQAGWDVGGYSIGFDTEEGVWQTIQLPWKDFVANRRTRIVEDAPPIKSDNIISLQILHSKFEFGGELNPRFGKGQLQLPLTYIGTYIEQKTPRFIHVGSAGATRWNRPGVDLEKEPPAVRLNDVLGGIMTYKLKGEDVIRDSMVPYLIVRPCALTEEPAGMPLLVDQGDVIRGKIGRDDVADLIVAALDLPVSNVTFEVKSTIPFSEPWTGPSEEVTRDWGALLAPLQEGVTGKTINGVYTGGSLSVV